MKYFTEKFVQFATIFSRVTFEWIAARSKFGRLLGLSCLVLLVGCSAAGNPAQQFQRGLQGGGRLTGYDPVADEFGPEFR